MNISIRKFLLINLLLAITLTTTLTAIGNYYLDQKDIEDHLDTLLLVATLSYESLLSDSIEQLPVHKLQHAVNTISSKIDYHHQKKLISYRQHLHAKELNFQIWDKNGNLLLASNNAPKTRLSSVKEGFSDEMINGQKWRVFTSVSPVNETTTMIGERYEARNVLAHRIAKDDFYIMLLTFPFAGILIWIIIGRSLHTLNRVARDISQRVPSYLEPVDTRGVPLEIKPVIEAINKLLFRLQEAFEREKRFAADAAHELKTPLAALKTQTQVAIRSEDPKVRETALQNVLASVDRSTHVVQQLLTLSRLVPGASDTIELTPVNLPKLSAEVIAQLVPTAMKKQIEIELIAENEDITLDGNMTALSILIRNLVDNSIRYTPKGGQIQVSVTQTNHQIRLIVKDNGPGIPPELRARVFERFFRVLGNKSPGSGLGLAIVQQIAKLHNAEVKLGTPSNGIGLEVEVIFPERMVNN